MLGQKNITLFQLFIDRQNYLNTINCIEYNILQSIDGITEEVCLQMECHSILKDFEVNPKIIVVNTIW